MKAATIYERMGTLYIHSLSKTVAGVWLMNAPVLAVSKANGREIGDAIRKCLAGSREGIPHPKVFERTFDAVQQLAGVKSYRTFVKSAKCVQVWMEGSETTMTPTRNGGSRGGFAPISHKSIVATNSEEALGAAVIEALAASE